MEAGRNFEGDNLFCLLFLLNTLSGKICYLGIISPQLSINLPEQPRFPLKQVLLGNLWQAAFPARQLVFSFSLTLAWGGMASASHLPTKFSKGKLRQSSLFSFAAQDKWTWELVAQRGSWNSRFLFLDPIFVLGWGISKTKISREKNKLDWYFQSSERCLGSSRYENHIIF